MFKELLVLIAMFVSLLIVSSKIQRLGSNAIVGSYQLSNHRTITLRADGTVISNLREEGKWILVDIVTNQYIIVWKKTLYIYKLFFENSKRTMQGTDEKGNSLTLTGVPISSNP